MRAVNKLHKVISQLAENNNISYLDAREIYFDAKKVNAAPTLEKPKAAPAKRVRTKKQAAPVKAAIPKTKKK